MLISPVPPLRSLTGSTNQRTVPELTAVLWKKHVACPISKLRMLGRQALSHCSHPQVCTLRGFRMEKKSILALDS